MNRSKPKILVAAAVVLAAVGFLAFAGAKDGWVYYLPVDQFVAQETARHSRVRLHGTVSPDNLSVSPASLSASFDLKGQTSSLRINSSGVIPDLFQADRAVVVEGRLDDAGVFQADMLLTKCSSKYEAVGAPHAASEDGALP
jgi:cytochrome c-type biogenesis protein CcmE